MRMILCSLAMCAQIVLPVPCAGRVLCLRFLCRWQRRDDDRRWRRGADRVDLRGEIGDLLLLRSEICDLLLLYCECSPLLFERGREDMPLVVGDRGERDG